MKSSIELALQPEEAASEQITKEKAAELLQIPANEITALIVQKKSIDARGRKVVVRLLCDVYHQEQAPPKSDYKLQLENVSHKKPVIVVGSGPAGIFAALKLIEIGAKPIIIERGKDVQARRRDLRSITQFHTVDPESNYCFGEGGAGTYSDGKLYTRSTKRGNVSEILNILVAHGASEEILIDTHPHIGTNKLPQIIANMRASIIAAGGEFHFNTRLDDFIVKGDKIAGIISAKQERIEAEAVILATGHSARDIFELFERKKWLIEAKAFALGLRIEHPQQIIDAAQYHCDVRNPLLPAASYSLVQQVNGRGVFSFCMCPGGFIVPAATAPGQVVVNGMSPSRRDSKFANSGMVVAVELSDMQAYASHGNLAGLRFQQAVEEKAWQAGGSTQSAPAQRVLDFCEGKLSSLLPETSYLPGLNSVQLSEVLPDFIAKSLKLALKEFGKKIKGYYSNEGVLVGVESRSSSPVRIPRDKETLEHPQIAGLFPCGEGAGYAGGIVSAAIDGQRCAQAAYMLYAKN